MNLGVTAQGNICDINSYALKERPTWLKQSILSHHKMLARVFGYTLAIIIICTKSNRVAKFFLKNQFLCEVAHFPITIQPVTLATIMTKHLYNF